MATRWEGAGLFRRCEAAGAVQHGTPGSTTSTWLQDGALDKVSQTLAAGQPLAKSSPGVKIAKSRAVRATIDGLDCDDASANNASGKPASGMPAAGDVVKRRWGKAKAAKDVPRNPSTLVVETAFGELRTPEKQQAQRRRRKPHPSKPHHQPTPTTHDCAHSLYSISDVAVMKWAFMVNEMIVQEHALARLMIWDRPFGGCGLEPTTPTSPACGYAVCSTGTTR